MSFAESILLTSVVLLAATSALFAIAYVILAARMPQGYVRTWKLCWIALTAFHALIALSFWLSYAFSPVPALVRWPVATLAQTAGFVHVVFLLGGVGDYASGRRQDLRPWLALAGASGVATTVAYPWAPSLALEGVF